MLGYAEDSQPIPANLHTSCCLRCCAHKSAADAQLHVIQCYLLLAGHMH
jgi:hypothetical protein